MKTIDKKKKISKKTNKTVSKKPSKLASKKTNKVVNKKLNKKNDNNIAKKIKRNEHSLLKLLSERKRLLIFLLIVLFIFGIIVYKKVNYQLENNLEQSVANNEQLEIGLDLLRRNNKRNIKDIYVSEKDFYKYTTEKVGLIGDSISQSSSDEIKKLFNNINMEAYPGRFIEEGPEVFEIMKEKDEIGDIFIFELGTNSFSGFRTDILEDVYNDLNGKPLIVPTIVYSYKGQERNRNRDIVNFVNTHDNCYLADWNKIVNDNEGLLNVDNIHPNDVGKEIFAQLLFRTVVDIMKNN